MDVERLDRAFAHPEQDLDDRLQLTDGGTGLPAAEEQAADGKLDVRVRYRSVFDEVLGEYDLVLGVLSTGQSCSARGAGLAGGRGNRPGEGQGSAMSTCLMAVRLPRAAPR